MFKKLRAFTMAEAILVMTILGIIATIMISTLKPAEYKEKSMQIMAKKVLSEIDVATTQIIMNNTVDGTFDTLIDPDTGNVLSGATMGVLSTKLVNLYKNYLTSIRKVPEAELSGFDFFTLKDGASVGIFYSVIPCESGTVYGTIFPGEINVSRSNNSCGSLEFDINDNEPPNVYGKDRFKLPLGRYGIVYAE